MCRRVPAPNDQSRRWFLEQVPAAEQNLSSNRAHDTVDEVGCGSARYLISRGSAGPASNRPSARGDRGSEYSRCSRLQRRADSAGNRQRAPQGRLRSERTAISQTGPCAHPQKSVLSEEFERPILSSAGRYMLSSIPELRVNARKNSKSATFGQKIALLKSPATPKGRLLTEQQRISTWQVRSGPPRLGYPGLQPDAHLEGPDWMR